MQSAVSRKIGTGPSTATSTRVAVLMGGDSSERDVSFESGRAVLEALRGAGVNAFAFDPSEAPVGELLALRTTTAFLALHGKGGEDGTVQRQLDALGIRYTGCGPDASAIAMDKHLSKKAFVRYGVPTAPYRIVDKGVRFARTDAVAEEIGYPLVVKPVAEGSSVGVTIARTRFGLYEGIEKAFAFGRRVMLEKFVDGREFCVGILGRKTLPAVEILHADEFYSFRAKYEDDRTVLSFDHGLPSQVKESVERAALAAFDSIGGTHYSRVDVMLSRSDSTPYVLEINTLPGMTSHSLLPAEAREAGLSFTDLCLEILRMAGEDV